MAKKMIPAINANEDYETKPVSPRRLWLRDHILYVYICAALLLIIAIFFGIRIYNNINHPITKFMTASAKDFNSSFRFEAQASKNGETVMAFSGAYAADPNKQNVKAVYTADYGTYSYMGAVRSEGESRYSGSLYNGKWRVRDCSEKVLNFFDFNTDYRRGGFDSASFLRFTELTSDYSADELESFMKLFKSRMDGNSPLASLTITSEGDAKTYTFDISVSEFFDLVREKGASIFFSAIDYDAFCALYEMNEKTVRNAMCRFSYTIDSSGWMTGIDISLTAGGDTFAFTCTMSDLGDAEVNIPNDFLAEVNTLEGEQAIP